MRICKDILRRPRGKEFVKKQQYHLIFFSGVLLRELASVKKIDKWNSDTIIAAIFCLVTLFCYNVTDEYGKGNQEIYIG